VDSKPNGVALARLGFAIAGLAVVLWMLRQIMGFVIGPHDDPDPHKVAKVLATVGALLLMAICLLGAAGAVGGERRRLGWWIGIAGVAVVALGGAAIIQSPVRTHQTDLIPELFWGLAVLAVGGTLLAALLAPATRRWVKGGG
jgi:hypothetical protein